MKNNKAGFTLIEMIFCISVILVILLLVIPNVTSKNNVVKGKGCEAQVEVVNSQIILYQIEHDELPTSISQLTSGSNPYLTQKQATCPNGKSIYISNLNCKMKLELRNWDKGACPFIPIRVAAGPYFQFFV